MIEALEGYDKGFQLGGRLINNLRYADDVVLIATSSDDLQELVNRVRTASEKIGLLINSDKTKVMVSGTNEMNTKISLNGEVLEEVESFVYLGLIFTRDDSCTNDIRKRLAMGRSPMQSLSSIWRRKDISTTTKIRLPKVVTVYAPNA